MPPLTIENSSALVDGGIPQPKGKEKTLQPKTSLPAVVDFAVEQAFYYTKGEVMEAGKTYQLPRAFAIEMQAARRGRIVVAAPVEAPVVEQPTKPAAKKESTNARQ